MPFAFGNNAQVAKFKEIRLWIGLLVDSVVNDVMFELNQYYMISTA